MFKSYKIKIIPNKEQECLIFKHINCCRFIWNYMLELQNARYKNQEKYIDSYKMIKLLPEIKMKNEWLKEVSNASLQNVCKDLHCTFVQFFQKTANYPKFKSKKRSKLSYPLRCDDVYFKSNDIIHIPKLGDVKYKTDFIFDFGKNIKITNPRLINHNNKWIVSFGMEYDNQVKPEKLTNNLMGIDLGIKELMTVAYGNEKIVFRNINKDKKMRLLQKRINFAQKILSRKYKTNKDIETKNILKQKRKLNRLYAKQTNIRANYIHQCTHKLISLLPCRIIVETLNIVSMLKNKYLSKFIQDAKFGEIIRQLKYKSEMKGIHFIQANRFFPSSKTCSCCGERKYDLKLSDRVFVCKKCGLVIDRDYNAALNLQKYEN